MSSTTEPSQTPAYAGAPNGNATAAHRNGMGVAALVIGIIALITCWTVVGGIVLGLIAVVFGAVGRGRARRGEATNGGAAIAGLVLGVVSIVLAIVLVAVGATFLVHHKSQLQKLNDCLKKASTQSQQDSCKRQFDRTFNNNN